MASYPQLSTVAELKAIKRLGAKATEEKPWIPEWLAELAGGRRNGGPLDEQRWVTTKDVRHTGASRRSLQKIGETLRTTRFRTPCHINPPSKRKVIYDSIGETHRESASSNGQRRITWRIVNFTTLQGV